jgi:hypothetical protein
MKLECLSKFFFLSLTNGFRDELQQANCSAKINGDELKNFIRYSVARMNSRWTELHETWHKWKYWKVHAALKRRKHLGKTRHRCNGNIKNHITHWMHGWAVDEPSLSAMNHSPNCGEPWFFSATPGSVSIISQNCCLPRSLINHNPPPILHSTLSLKALRQLALEYSLCW